MSMIERLEAMLEAGRDSALLRYSLGVEFDRRNEQGQAAVHLRRAVAQDPDYSAAWKLLGRVLGDLGDVTAAIDAYERGIEAAGRRGDRQAEKEMTVFVRRLKRESKTQS